MQRDPEPLTRHQSEECERALRRDGSVTAAMALAHDAVQHHTGDPDLLRARRDLVLKHETTGNREVLGVLCLISGYIEDYRFCDYWLDVVEEAGDPYFGYELYRILTYRRTAESHARAYLRRSAEGGYLPARKELVRLKSQKMGPLGAGWRSAYALYLAIVATVIFVRDSEDSRLPRV